MSNSHIRTCQVRGCHRPIYGQSWCHAHWTARRQGGTFMSAGQQASDHGPTGDLMERLMGEFRRDLALMGISPAGLPRSIYDRTWK